MIPRPLASQAHPRPAACALPRRSLLSRLTSLLALRHQRARLALLDDHALRDIGLTRHDADREASRPLWDVPGHWHR